MISAKLNKFLWTPVTAELLWRFIPLNYGNDVIEISNFVVFFIKLIHFSGNAWTPPTSQHEVSIFDLLPIMKKACTIILS